MAGPAGVVRNLKKRMLGRLIPPFVRGPLERAIDAWIRRHGYVPFDTEKFYAEDGLYSTHNDEFRRDPAFLAAYRRGLEASHGVDPGFAWRLHIALWAARLAAASVPAGDFVECGVNAGLMSSAIMHDLGFAALPRRFFLVDTFSGPVLEQFSAEERRSGWVEMVERMRASGSYVTDLARVRANFAEWPNAVVAPGAVPDILPAVTATQIAFLHLDLNCAAPEAAALAYFWPLMPPGAVVLMDDYAHHGVEAQKKCIDQWASGTRASVLSLPTGQGLIVR